MKLVELKDVIVTNTPVAIFKVLNDPDDVFCMLEFDDLYQGDFENVPDGILNLDIFLIHHDESCIRIFVLPITPPVGL